MQSCSLRRSSSAARRFTQKRYVRCSGLRLAHKLIVRLGNVFEKRLIETYINENGTDPVNGEELSADDLMDLKHARVVRPRPPTLTSIPALLSSFQNEWDALILETYQLKQQLAETRQELSTAFYYNDSAEKVIARLQKERDEARDALSRVTVSGGANGASVTNGDAMQIDGQEVSEEIGAKIEQTQQQLSSTRRKRPVPADWATADAIETYDTKQSSTNALPGSKSIAVNDAGDLVLYGGHDGSVGVYGISSDAIVESYNPGTGAILDGTFYGAQPVISTSSGTVLVLRNGKAQAQFRQHAGAATAIARHPCGDILASVGSDKSYVLYDLVNSTVVTQVFCDSELTTVAFHPDGHLLAVGTVDGIIKLYDVKTSENVGNFSSASSAASAIQSLSFSENGTWLASALSGSSSVTIWDLRKLTELKVLDIGTAVTGVSWDYTGQFLAACGPGGVVVNQYTKSSKAWSEPLRKAVNAVDVKWGAQAKSLIALTGEGAISVLGA